MRVKDNGRKPQRGETVTQLPADWVPPSNVKHKPFSEPVRDWYCSARGCTNAYVADLVHPDQDHYKFCPYHWGVIVHNLIEVQWASLEEVLQIERQ